MVQIGFKCNRGVVRNNNEDACFVIPSHDVYVVADGVGGNNSGEVASRTAVEEIAQYVNSEDIEGCQSNEEIFEFFQDAIERANYQIYKLGMENDANRGMATTLVVTYIKDGTAYISNVGDSRVYLFRDGLLRQITRDHTYVNELIDQGVITQDEAKSHSQKNVITKALGADAYIDPDYYMAELKKDDILVLCSDGLYGEVKEAKLIELLASGQSMNETCTAMVNEAIRCGGRDNITVICLRI
jgi:protein phosphatase